MKIGIIGCGNIGSIILESILSLKKVSKKDVIVSDIDKNKLLSVSKKYLILTTQSNLETVKFADIIILAVKPQQIKEVLLEIKDNISPQKTILSVAAGVKINFIKKILGTNIPVIRAMPNLPIKVGSGITAICYDSLLNTTRNFDKVKNIVTKIFSVTGDIVEVKEKYMDLITAVSGSGPAYIFYISEILQKTAQKLGLNKFLAEKLVNRTIFGSGKMLLESNLSAEKLREAVTSKGGTTEQAIKVFKSKKLENIFHQAVKKAKNRAQQLSKIIENTT